jgi:hypothetical protein
MDSIFETLVAKISAANELFQADHPSVDKSFYLKDKVPENSKIYHNTYNEYKSKKISERELRRPWSKLSTNYKIMVILNFLKEFETQHPDTNMNLIRYDMLLNIDHNKGLDLKMDYDFNAGRLKKIFGYLFNDGKIVKTDNMDDFIGNKIKLKLRYKKNIDERQCH